MTDTFRTLDSAVEFCVSSLSEVHLLAIFKRRTQEPDFLIKSIYAPGVKESYMKELDLVAEFSTVKQITYHPTVTDRLETLFPGVPVLKGIAKWSGDGWKDTLMKGDEVFVVNAMMPAPYVVGQYPRLGRGTWSAQIDRCAWSVPSPMEVQKYADELVAHTNRLAHERLEGPRDESRSQQ